MTRSTDRTVDEKSAANKKRGSTSTYESALSPAVSRESGDEVNRFLLCSLVSESAKQIKARAERAGEHLPMTMVVRGVLRSYRAAAKEERGALAGPGIDMDKLRDINKKVLKEEITRHTKERVENGKARLAWANRLGDEARINAEKEALESAIAARDQLTNQFKK